MPEDPAGFVTIVKDGVEAKIVPESLPVWLDHGWTEVEDADKDEPAGEPSQAVAAAPQQPAPTAPAPAPAAAPAPPAKA